MGLIRLDQVRKQLGDRIVLDDLSIEFNTEQRVGLVGPNGAGKTTLFRLILGHMKPESGGVSISKGLELGYLAQEPDIGLNRTLHDEVMSAFADLLAVEEQMHALSEQMGHTPPGPQMDDLLSQYDKLQSRFEHEGGYTYEQKLDMILDGLGFTKNDRTLPMSALSGGQKCRAALARLLLREPEMLLLDEPTNHLDIDACQWLEDFLVKHRGGAIIISHDRYLLDRVATSIVEVNNGKAQHYPGNYSNYVQVKDLRRLTQERQFEKDRDFIEKEKQFIAKHMGSQRTAEARGRRTRLERRLGAGEFVTDRPGEQARVKIDFGTAGQMIKEGLDVLDIRRLSKSYGDKPLFKDLSLLVRAEQSLGITGPNGTGKSTLIKCCLGMIKPDEGEYRFSNKASVGYFAQESTDLTHTNTIVQEIQSIRGEWLESHCRAYAARFLFRGDDPFKRVGSLSGGEQSRVRFMKMILRQPNVLILDEPTNHLDIPSREVLEEALMEYPGTIIAISHDRYFLDRICDRLLVMRDAGARQFDCNYSRYMEIMEEERIAAERAAARAAEAAKAKAARKPAAPTSAPSKASKTKSRFWKLSVDELEAKIMESETRITQIQEKFAAPDVYQNRTKLDELNKQLEQVKTDLAELNAEWESRAA
ncbi:MAG: ribosomal protection-like ABC-F family protein [Phycisphaerae bacterium]